MAAADFFEDKEIDSTELAERAKTRAAHGYAINLHFNRHVAGATYGSKGETKAEFLAKLKKQARGLSKPQKKEMVVSTLRTALDKDVKKMKEVIKEDVTAKPWEQLRKEVGKDKAPALKKQIAERIDKGENQIASQPFDF